MEGLRLRTAVARNDEGWVTMLYVWKNKEGRGEPDLVLTSDPMKSEQLALAFARGPVRKMIQEAVKKGKADGLDVQFQRLG
jgi:hypothetical protein